MIMPTRTYVVQAVLLLLFFTGCKSKYEKEAAMPDTYKRGTIHISCDESFKPVIDQQVAVYEQKYPGARIIVHYKPEAECLRDFLTDSIRMVIATRGCTEEERRSIVDSLKVSPSQLVVARDIIAVIVNPASKDTFYSMQELKELLSGKSKENLIPVFDGARATSTVRFMLDSVLRGEPLSKNVVAAKSSTEVIEYVSKVPNAIGFVGFSWVGNQDDTSQVAQRKKYRVIYLESTDSANAYVQPAQLFIYTKTYPMVRDLVYVLKERHDGLAHAFARFLEGNDKGQLIFRRAYLMPALWPNYIRNAKLNETLTTNK